MSYLSPRITLATPRIPPEDGRRQETTADEILRRLQTQPGVLLADEVGLGKTFVALAVAVSLLERTDLDRPVVVMVPPGLRHKWPREWQVFRSLCMNGAGPEIRATEETVERPGDFLKLFDDPPERRRHLIFATHRALSNMQVDPWIHLALVRQSMLRRSSLAEQWNAFPRWAGQLLTGAPFKNEDYVAALLAAPPRRWADVHRSQLGVPPDDDPVPAAVVRACSEVDMSPLRTLMETLPLRWSAFIDERLADFRTQLHSVFRELWPDLLARTATSSPLLILDEAHHIRNPTQLAQLFEAFGSDKSPPLNGVFDRMLFLTATPFQLGHQELIEVLRRFTALAWSDTDDKEVFEQQLDDLSATLDHYRACTLRLDTAWGRLDVAEVEAQPDPAWWETPDPSGLSDTLASAAACVVEARAARDRAETHLRPWVIRHTRPHGPHHRELLAGRRILPDTDETPDTHEGGLAIDGATVLPFLLAARAQAAVALDGPDSKARALFADGLASSYEAYLDTRAPDPCGARDDDTYDNTPAAAGNVDWYLEQIDRALPKTADGRVSAPHPKLAATVERVVDLWWAGEKVVVFSFFVATGRALRDHIAHALSREILREGAEKLGLPVGADDEVERRLRLIGDRFHRGDSPLRRTADAELDEILRHAELTRDDADHAKRITLRFLRTPSFLVRYFDLRAGDDTAAFHAAIDAADRSGVSLRDKITTFARFAAERVPDERVEMFDALESLQTGGLVGESVSDEADETIGSGRLPNVRLANGSVKTETRRRLMLAFNTPFFPEVLVASAVLGEGVDLHLDCRHVIHHDLDWNPSIVEQRTGRVDRIGSKAEKCARPIAVYEPYVESTQDEKQFRVLTDRARWFGVLMGERLELDESTTDRLAARVPLPEPLADALTVCLGVCDTPRIDMPPPPSSPPPEKTVPTDHAAPFGTAPGDSAPDVGGDVTLGDVLPVLAAAPPEMDRRLGEILGTGPALRAADVTVGMALGGHHEGRLAPLLADVLCPQSAYGRTRTPQDAAEAFAYHSVLRRPISAVVGPLADNDFVSVLQSAGTRLSNTLARGRFSAGSLNASTLHEIGMMPAAGYVTVRELLVHMLERRLATRTRAAGTQRPTPPVTSPAVRAAAMLATLAARAREEGRQGSLADYLAAIAADPESQGPETARLWAELNDIDLDHIATEVQPAPVQVPLEQLTGRLLGRLDQRERGIFVERELHSGTGRTLQAIADDYGVSRERIRQLQARARDRITSALQSDEFEPVRAAAEDVHTQVGSAAPCDAAAQVLAGLADPPAAETHLHAALLLWCAGPYEDVDGWLVTAPAADLADATVAALQAEADGGVLAVPAATAALANLRIKDEHTAAWLARFPQFRRIDDSFVEWPANTADRAEAVLRLAGRAMTTDELHFAVGGVIRATVVNALGLDPRFTRTGLNTWELTTWGGVEYTNAIDMMGRLIAASGGEMEVDDLAHEMSSRFGLAEVSTLINVSAPQFITGGGRVRICPNPASNVAFGDPARTRAMYRTGNTWTLRVAVDTEVLRGSGSPIPTAAAHEIGLRPTEDLTLETSTGPLSASWPGLNPLIGSLRSIAADLGAVDGDHLLLTLEPKPTIRLVREADLRCAPPLLKLALLVGVQASGDDDTATLLGAIARALDLPAATAPADICQRLADRGESHLADLVPGTSPQRGADQQDRRLRGLDDEEREALLALCADTTAQELAAMTTAVAAHAVSLANARFDDEFIDAPLGSRIAEALGNLISDPAVTADPENRRLIRGAADYFVIDDDDFTTSLGLEDDARIFNAVCRAVGRTDLVIPIS